jgi:FlaG/FlaF family flagellin (archaellin)
MIPPAPTRQSSNRAVSDVVAFVLTFSIIIASVGLVATLGFGALDGLQESEQDANAERAISAMAVGIEDILEQRSPRRQLSLNPQGRTLTVTDKSSSRVNVTVEFDGNQENTGFADGALVYSPGGGTEIAYEAGAVFRRDGDGATMIREPLVSCEQSRSSVTLPTLKNDQGGVSSDGSVSIEVEIDNRLASQSVHPDEDTGAQADVVLINVTESAYPDAWGRFFADESGWQETSPGSDIYRCTAPGTAFVRTPNLEIEFTT